MKATQKSNGKQKEKVVVIKWVLCTDKKRWNHAVFDANCTEMEGKKIKLEDKYWMILQIYRIQVRNLKKWCQIINLWS